MTENESRLLSNRVAPHRAPPRRARARPSQWSHGARQRGAMFRGAAVASRGIITGTIDPMRIASSLMSMTLTPSARSSVRHLARSDCTSCRMYRMTLSGRHAASTTNNYSQSQHPERTPRCVMEPRRHSRSRARSYLAPRPSPLIDADAMRSHQVAPRARTASARFDCKAMIDAPSSSASSSSLSSLFRRFSISRRRRRNEYQERASWPSLEPPQPRDSFRRRARESLASAWAAIHEYSSASTDGLLAPPTFVLRTQRRFSQSLNTKVVRAVGKDLRRIESERRSSVTSAESASHVEEETESDQIADDTDTALRLSERLSLSLGRCMSRDFVPMLIEGSPLERRVREIVFGLMKTPSTLEGHVCSTFFKRQEDFVMTTPDACRYYLKRVRETIDEIVQFVVEYRLPEMGRDAFPPSTLVEPSPVLVKRAVRRAVEEYFCFSMKYELRQWAAGAAAAVNRVRFKRTLARWSAIPADSKAFGFKDPDPHLAAQPFVAEAIAKLQDLESIVTPSKKMESLLAACVALSQFIASIRGPNAAANDQIPTTPSSRVCLGDADSFLPLLIFVVSRSGLRDPFLECALLHGLYPFVSEHGEHMYYLTMLEAALEFIRTH